MAFSRIRDGGFAREMKEFRPGRNASAEGPLRVLKFVEEDE